MMVFGYANGAVKISGFQEIKKDFLCWVNGGSSLHFFIFSYCFSEQLGQSQILLCNRSSLLILEQRGNMRYYRIVNLPVNDII